MALEHEVLTERIIGAAIALHRRLECFLSKFLHSCLPHCDGSTSKNAISANGPLSLRGAPEPVKA